MWLLHLTPIVGSLTDSLSISLNTQAMCYYIFQVKARHSCTAFLCGWRRHRNSRSWHMHRIVVFIYFISGLLLCILKMFSKHVNPWLCLFYFGSFVVFVVYFFCCVFTFFRLRQGIHVRHSCTADDGIGCVFLLLCIYIFQVKARHSCTAFLYGWRRHRNSRSWHMHRIVVFIYFISGLLLCILKMFSKHVSPWLCF